MRIFALSLPYLTVIFASVLEIASPNRDLLALEEKQLMHCLKSLKENTFFCA